MAKRETCLWIFPVRLGVFFISFCITVVSIALIAATFFHKNPMVIHLSVVHTVLPWVYMILQIVTGVVGIIGMIASIAGNYGFMVFFRILFWLMNFLIVYIWQILIFILALINRSKTTSICNELNPNQNLNVTEAANFTVSGYTTTLLGLNQGETYGLANCDQAVQAGVVGLAILLFAGALFMTWFAFIVNKCSRSLNKNYTGKSKKDARWDDDLNNLQSAYAQDKKNAPKYPMNEKKDTSMFARGLIKMKLKSKK